jgi:hypothetical protein
MSMSRGDLEQLLRTADAQAPAAPLAGDLSARVHRRLARRRLRQATAATLGVVILVGAGVFAILRTDPPPPPHHNLSALPAMTTRPALPDTADAAHFDLTATLHELTAQKLLAAQGSSRSATLSSPPPDAHFLRDRAALVLVYDADRDVRENRPADARARYRRAIELFPHTHWAQVARQRLKEIQT